MKMKKLLAVLLSAILLCSAFVVPVQAKETEIRSIGRFTSQENAMSSSTEFEYNEYTSSIEIIQYKYHSQKVIIPDTINGKPVTSISNFCEEDGYFEGSRMISITIPNSVKNIAACCFLNCTNLKSVTIPDQVTFISQGTFYNCTDLTTVTLPVNITKISSKAFYGCSSLKDVYYGGTKEQWNNITIDTDNDAIKNANIHYGSGTSSDNFVDSGKDTSTDTSTDAGTHVSTDTSTNSNSVTGKIRFNIGDWGSGHICFYIWAKNADGEIRHLYNGGWQEDDNWGSKKLLGTYVAGSDGIYESYNIEFCEGWDYFVIFHNQTTGAQTYDCVITKDAIGKTAHITGNKLEHPVDSEKTCVEADFDNVPGCGPYLQITSTGNIIGRIKPSHDDGAKIVGRYVYNGINTLEKNGVERCTPEKIKNAIDSYGTNANDVWKEYLNLEKEYGSNPDNKLDVYNILKPTENPTDYITPSDFPYTPKSDELKYELQNDGTIAITKYIGVKKDAFIIPKEINGRTVTSLIASDPWGIFDKYGDFYILSITLPESLKTIGDHAFVGCSVLQSITIPDSVTTIGDSAFAGCESLTKILIPDSVTTLGNYVFCSCILLQSITIPDNVTSIGNSAFSGCKSLTSITIPDGVTTIGDSAFSGCRSLTSITIPDGITSIDDYTFSDCTSLTSITIPHSVTSIGSCAFVSCNSLTSITIPANVTKIGKEAFSGCQNLTDVYYGGTEELWNSIDIGENNGFLVFANIHFNPDYQTDTSTSSNGSSSRYSSSYTSSRYNSSYTSSRYSSSYTSSRYNSSYASSRYNSSNNSSNTDTEENSPFNESNCTVSFKVISADGTEKEFDIQGKYNNDILGYLIDYSPKVGDKLEFSCEKEQDGGVYDQGRKFNITDENITQNADSIIVKVTENLKTSQIKINFEQVKSKDDSFPNLGDVDGDGKVTAKDSMQIQRYVINLKKLDENQLKAADVNGDGKVTAKDALAVLRYSVGMAEADSPINKPIVA